MNLKSALVYVPIIPQKARELLAELSALVCDLAAEVDALKKGAGDGKA